MRSGRSGPWVMMLVLCLTHVPSRGFPPWCAGQELSQQQRPRRPTEHRSAALSRCRHACNLACKLSKRCLCVCVCVCVFMCMCIHVYVYLYLCARREARDVDTCRYKMHRGVCACLPLAAVAVALGQRKLAGVHSRSAIRARHVRSMHFCALPT